MKLKLVKFEGNWADEMDIYGFCIMTDEEWEFKKNEIKHCSYPQEIYFGTNECEVCESPQDFLSNFEEVDITLKEANILKKFFSEIDYGYGRFPLMEGNASKEFYEEYGKCPKSWN